MISLQTSSTEMKEASERTWAGGLTGVSSLPCLRRDPCKPYNESRTPQQKQPTSNQTELRPQSLRPIPLSKHGAPPTGFSVFGQTGRGFGQRDEPSSDGRPWSRRAASCPADGYGADRAKISVMCFVRYKSAMFMFRVLISEWCDNWERLKLNALPPIACILFVFISNMWSIDSCSNTWATLSWIISGINRRKASGMHKKLNRETRHTTSNGQSNHQYPTSLVTVTLLTAHA